MNHLLRICGAIVVLLCLTIAGRASDAQTIVPKVIDEPVWIYPVAAERAGVWRGEVEALLSISDTGELVDFLVLGCSHPVFASEVARSLPHYRFAPARVRGEPRATRMPVTFRFQQEGGMISFQRSMIDVLPGSPLEQRRHAVSFLCPPGRLDQPIAPTRVVSPRYPSELLRGGSAGEVTVEFIVDGEGRVRLPAVETAAHPSFAREAVAAIMEWRFDPPRHGGQPVLVRVVQSFQFAPPPPAARR